MIFDTNEEVKNILLKVGMLNVDKNISRTKAFDDQARYNKQGILRKILSEKDGKKEFSYYHIKDQKEANEKDLDRIKKLLIPPSWDDVWISSDSSSLIQATGIDSKGRKQYRYTSSHTSEAEKKKFARLYKFIGSMSKLDKVMEDHSKLNLLAKEKVIQTMLSIIKKLHIRVGKEVYARKNKSYGITSLRKKHLKIIEENEGKYAKLNFKAKSKMRVTYAIKDLDIINHIEVLMKLDGERLFQYVDENNKLRIISDVDLNQYIQKYMGEEFTVKDFRSYASNFYFIKALLDETRKRIPNTNKKIKKNILNAIKSTAYHLRHTKAISKKSYILEYAINLYRVNPKFYIDRKNEKNIDAIVLELLNMYKEDTKLSKNNKN